MPLEQVRDALLNIFKKWGLPQWIKVDNGRPFGDPQRQSIPALALWLIAYNIGVIFNRPRTPQDNAKVERSQGVLSNWTEWQKCLNATDLQQRLLQEAEFHNLHYPVSRLGGKTRAETFDNILESPNRFEQQNFELQRVLDFLAKGSWERDVSQNGQFSFRGQRMGVGKKIRP